MPKWLPTQANQGWSIQQPVRPNATNPTTFLTQLRPFTKGFKETNRSQTVAPRPHGVARRTPPGFLS